MAALLGLVIQLDPEEHPSPEDVSSLLESRDTPPDLVLLPELWNASFEGSSLRRGQVDNLEDFLQPLFEYSAAHPACLLCPGSLPVVVAPDAPEPRLVNRSVLLQAGKILGHYDKLHLFSQMDEQLWVRAGKQSLVCDTMLGGRPTKVGLAVCYDLRFPELWREMALQGAELILHPSQFPLKRHDAYRHLLRARAIENGQLVISCNRRGKSGNTEFGGGSVAWGPATAHSLLQPSEELLCPFSFDLEQVQDFRRKLDVLQDVRYELQLKQN